MSKVLMNKVLCRLCGEKALDTIWECNATPVGDAYMTTQQAAKDLYKYPLALQRCKKCGHLQLSHVVSPDELYISNYLYETSTSLDLDRHFKQYAKHISALSCIPPKALIVDIGSNNGVLLGFLKQMGFSVCGVEPSSRIAQKAISNGIPTLNALFTSKSAGDLASQHGKANVITANNVFANIDDLDAFMEAVDILLEKSGWFIIETGYALDTINNVVFDNIYHEHISYFLCAPLRGFLNRHGFEIQHAERVPTKGGSIRVYCRRLGQGLADWTVDGLIAMERELGFDNLSPYQRFNDVLDKQKDQIMRSLDAATNKGIVAGFGAAVGSTTFLYWLGVEGQIEYLVDDNILKQGLYSPGLGLPVFPASELTKYAPKTVLNLAWRYRHAICKRHMDYLKNGGTLLQPFPTLQTYEYNS